MPSLTPTNSTVAHPPAPHGGAAADAGQPPPAPTTTSAGTGPVSAGAGGAMRRHVMLSLRQPAAPAPSLEHFSYTAPTAQQLQAHIDQNPDIAPHHKDEVKRVTQQWLADAGTPLALKQQAFEKKHQAMAQVDLLPGDIMVRKEFPPESQAHAFSLNKQKHKDLGGLTENHGDANAFHIMLASHTPGNPLAISADQDDEGMQVEARGGLGTTNALRVQTSSVQAGSYWIYRPADSNLGDFAAQAALMWKDMPYSKSSLGASMRPGDTFRDFGDAAQAQIAAIAEHGFSNAPAQGRQENEALFLPTQQSGKEWNRGDMCSSMVVRAYQASAVHIMDAKRPEDPEKAALYVPQLTGMMRNNAEGMSPRVLEHFCRTGLDDNGDKQFRFVGVVTVKPDEVAYPERRYDLEGKPIAA